MKKSHCLCGSCKKETNCDIVFEDTKHIREYDEWHDVELRVTKCHGCDEYTIATLHYSDDCWVLDEYGERQMVPDIEIIYPKGYKDDNKKTEKDKFVESFKSRIKQLEDFCPYGIILLIAECITAYNNNLNMLTTVGFRMVVDAICQEKEKNGEISKAKRDELLEKGHISENQKRILEKIVDFGNDAAHQFKPLENKDIESCLDAIEAILNNIYRLPEINKKLPMNKNNRR